jgi:hypothetical protein
MQGVPYHLLLDGYPPFLPYETDTATPHTLIPIYYIHTLKHPLCSHSFCACQRREKDRARLLGELVAGTLLLYEAAAFTKSEGAVMSETTSTPPTAPGRYTVVPVEDMPVLCHLYGHSWKETENAAVKACALCHIRGYCPGCTPQAPDNAQPFFCTAHTPQRQVY